MRLTSFEQRDEAGFAVELIIRTTMSFRADDSKKQKDWDAARKKLQEAQELLIASGFYSSDFDPPLAAY